MRKHNKESFSAAAQVPQNVVVWFNIQTII